MELTCTLDEMRGRGLVVEQDFRSMKGFENIENFEARVKERKEMLNKRVEELEMKMRNQEVCQSERRKENQAWTQFVSGCVELATISLELRKHRVEMEKLEGEKESIDVQTD